MSYSSLRDRNLLLAFPEIVQKTTEDCFDCKGTHRAFADKVRCCEEGLLRHSTHLSLLAFLSTRLWGIGARLASDVIHDEIAIRIGSWFEQFRSLSNVHLSVPRCLRE